MIALPWKKLCANFILPCGENHYGFFLRCPTSFYNRPCILNQTYPYFELIVVDDCSTDCSGEIIRGIAAADNRVIYIRNIKNSGVAKTLNNGLEIANGEYIARMDADDKCDTTRFEKQIQYLIGHPNCILCGTYADVYNGEKTYIQGNTQEDLKKHLVKNNPFVHSSVMFKRSINGKEIRYPETKGFEDYALWIELSNDGEFYIIPEVLVHRVDFNNLETKKTWEGFNKFKIYKKLLHYQYKATLKTKTFFLGFASCAKTLGKIVITGLCLKLGVKN